MSMLDGSGRFQSNHKGSTIENTTLESYLLTCELLIVSVENYDRKTFIRLATGYNTVYQSIEFPCNVFYYDSLLGTYNTDGKLIMQDTGHLMIALFGGARGGATIGLSCLLSFFVIFHNSMTNK